MSAFALDKNLAQKKLMEGHHDYYHEDDILHDIGIIESKKLWKLYIYFNEHKSQNSLQEIFIYKGKKYRIDLDSYVSKNNPPNLMLME